MIDVAAQSQLLREVKEAWSQAGIAAALRGESSGRVVAVVAQRRDEAFEIAIGALEAAGARTCCGREAGVRSIFAFSETGSIAIDLCDGTKQRRSLWRAWNGRRSPTVALLGPDGVGKSTALKLVREWFEQNAPFVEVTVRQWRPNLLPSLASMLGKPEDPSGNHRPRRTPGRLHWVRLFYYYLDFLLGSWWKDRNRGDGARLIVYDRCALDMWVDPYRFALQSRRGTKLLWKLTPRPQTLIVLHDAAERIAQRKDDLPEPVVAEHMASWLELAAADEVHAVIRVNGGPEEMGRRIRDLFIGTFLRQYEHPSAAPGSPMPLDTAPGSRLYAVLPGPTNPRFLVPLDSRRAASQSLAIYNAQRPLARAAKGLLRASLRTGVAQWFLPKRSGVASEALREFLAHAVGEADVSIAASLGTPGPNQKPVLQIMNRQGGILAYAKIGWNERTAASVRNEYSALQRLAGAHFSSAAIPHPLDGGWVEGKFVLVEQAGAGRRQANEPAPEERHVRFLAELHQVDAARRALPCPERATIAQLESAGHHYYAHLLDCVRSEYAGYGAIPCGAGHGDFTAWNLRSNGAKLLVFDWETFDREMPAGWDLFRLIVASEVEIRGTKPGVLYAAVTQPGPVRDRIEDYFLAIGAHADLIEPLFVSYAAHELARGVLELGERSSEKDRAMQRTCAALLALALNERPAAAERQVARVAV